MNEGSDLALARSARRDTPSSPPTSLIDCFGADGQIVVQSAADSVGLAKGDLASTLSLAPVAVYKTARARAPRTQARLRELLEIIDRVTPWAGGRPQATAEGKNLVLWRWGPTPPHRVTVDDPSGRLPKNQLSRR